MLSPEMLLNPPESIKSGGERGLDVSFREELGLSFDIREV
jgi:hypothetical protein